MHYRGHLIHLYLVFHMAALVCTGYRKPRSGTWSKWTGENFSCEQPPTPKHGEVSLPNGTHYGAIVFFRCYTGYKLLGDSQRKCLQNGSWDGVSPRCKKECLPGTHGESCEQICGACNQLICDPSTGICPGGCHTGYKGDNCTEQCDTGTYGNQCNETCGQCRQTSCDPVTGICLLGCQAGYQGAMCNTHCGVTQIENGANTEQVQNRTATVSYTCNPGFELVGHEKLTCNHSTGVWDLPVPKCIKEGSVTVFCQVDTDYRGTTWQRALPGDERTLQCPTGFSGNITRRCGPDGTWRLPTYNCTRDSVEAILAVASSVSNATTVAEVANALEKISSLASVNIPHNGSLTTSSQLTDGELNLLAISLGELATALSKFPDNVDNVTDIFLESTSNMIDNTHYTSWKALSDENGVGAVNILSAVDSFSEAMSTSLIASTQQKRTVVKTNLAMEVRKFCDDDVTFPDKETTDDDSDWLKNSKSSIRLDAVALQDKNTDSSIQYVKAAVMYRNLSGIIPSTTDSDKGSKTGSNNGKINGPILALSVSPHLTGPLDPPVRISFEHDNNELTDPSCRFWLFQSGSRGYWSNTGCSAQFTNDSYTVCECNHLTNFAVLMSPFQEADAESIGLRIVSIIGIGVSIFCLLATLVLHILLWKYLKNDRTSLLANLCVALVISYVLFLAGVDRTENSVVCTVIAACLHYIYLVVFCIMLAEGIEMAITVLYVFKTKLSRIKWLLLLSWFLPAVIVGTSLGVTKTKGFGNERFCWLSNDKGLIWAFVGPTLAVILFNVGCLILVLRAIFNSRTVEAKESSEKIKTGLRSLCVLLPLTGVSWILGIFYISEDFSFMQYIFAICNGSQGFFIFLFHCLLSPQVKRALSLRKRKKYAISSFGKITSKSTSKSDNSISEIDTEKGYKEINSSGKYDTNNGLRRNETDTTDLESEIAGKENCNNGMTI